MNRGGKWRFAVSDEVPRLEGIKIGGQQQRNSPIAPDVGWLWLVSGHTQPTTGPLSASSALVGQIVAGFALIWPNCGRLLGRPRENVARSQ
jgi:hypothetical protein